MAIRLKITYSASIIFLLHSAALDNKINAWTCNLIYGEKISFTGEPPPLKPLSFSWVKGGRGGKAERLSSQVDRSAVQIKSTQGRRLR